MLKRSLVILGSLATLCVVTALSLKDSTPTVQQLRQSSVRILGDEFGGSGSFIQYNNKSYILTNRHVCEAAVRSPYLKIIAENGRVFYKQIVRKSKTTDLCLIDGDKTYPQLQIAPRTFIGEELKMLGHPQLQPLTITDAQYIGDLMVEIITKINAKENECSGVLYKTDEFVRMVTGVSNYCVDSFLSSQIHGYSRPGSSGSPVVNRKGEVSGVLFAGDNKDQFQSFMIPLSELQKFLGE